MNSQTHRRESRRWLGLAVVLLATFMDLLDTTIVNVAIPSIQHNLSMTYSAIQWVTAGYILAFSLLLVTGGRLGDIFGRKRIFIIGIAGFTLASFLCGAAPTAGVLVAARVLQGAMAALMVPQILATIQVTFSSEERGKVVAMYSSVTGLAGFAGPLLGGLLISLNLFGWDWRTIFFVNVPVGLIAIVGGLLAIDDSRAPEKPRLDLPGVFFVTFALLLLVYPLVQGRELGWPLWTYISMAASIPALALFLWYERRKNQAGTSPLILLSPFRFRSFWGGLIVMWAIGAALSSFLFIFSLWMQIGLGFSAIHAGLTFLPFTIGISLTAGLIGSRYSTRLGRSVVRIGASLLIAGLLTAVYTLHHFGIATTSWDLVPALLLYGAGFGLLFVSIFNFILAGLEPKEAGSVAGLVNTMQQLGSAVGIAVVGVIFFSFIGHLANQSFAVYKPELVSDLQASHIPAAATESIVRSIEMCFYDRSNEKDPTAIPASCRQNTTAPGSAKLSTLARDISLKSNRQNFTDSFIRSIWVEIGICVVMLMSISLLPRHITKPKDALIM